jgi:hypothetical protein
MSDDTTTTDAAGTDAAGSEGPEDFKSEESKQRVLADLKREREQRKELQARLAEFEDRDKTELQKLQDELAERDARLADLPKQARSQAIRFASQATAAGFLDPEDALLNLADVDLSDGEAVKAALEDLAERKPHLVRQDRKKPPTRPKPAKGEPSDDPTGGLTGKERAAAALRQMRN